jgi:hypothetical protein
MKTIVSSLSVLASLALFGCGGGGGGPDYTGAGNVTLRVSQSEIDTGDRTKITVTYNELHPDGVVIKMRYDAGLEYIPDTSLWRINGKNLDATPASEVTGDVAESIFLIYNLGRDVLGKNNSGELIFELRGIEETAKNSEIEVDMDVLEEDTVFSAENPEFSPEDSVPLMVK